MRASTLTSFAVLLVIAVPATADIEFTPGWSTRMVWDSNVFRVGDRERVRITDGVAVPLEEDQRKKEQDVSFYGGPDLRLRRDGSRLNLDLSYRLRYEQFVNQTDLSDFEHFLRNGLRWQVTPRDEFSMGHQFVQSSAINQTFDGELLTLRRQIQRHQLDGRWIHRLSPMTQIEAAIDGSMYDYEQEEARDSQSVRGYLQMTRAISPRQTIGLGTAVSRQELLATNQTPDSGTSYYEAFGIWNVSLTQKLRFTASAGPAWSDPDAVDSFASPRYALREDPPGQLPGAYLTTFGSCRPDPDRPCPLLLAGFVDADTLVQLPAPRPVDSTSNPEDPVEQAQNEGSLTYFGRLSLEHRGDETSTSVSYSRSASSSSGVGAGTILDAVSGRILWEPTPRWEFELWATWQRQTLDSETLVGVQQTVLPGGGTVFVDASGQIVTDPGLAAYLVPNVATLSSPVELGNNDYQADVYRVELRASRRFGERFTVTGKATYWRQDSSTELSATAFGQNLTNEADGVRFELGFSWELEPIRF